MGNKNRKIKERRNAYICWVKKGDNTSALAQHSAETENTINFWGHTKNNHSHTQYRMKNTRRPETLQSTILPIQKRWCMEHTVPTTWKHLTNNHTWISWSVATAKHLRLGKPITCLEQLNHVVFKKAHLQKTSHLKKTYEGLLTHRAVIDTVRICKNNSRCVCVGGGCSIITSRNYIPKKNK